MARLIDADLLVERLMNRIAASEDRAYSYRYGLRTAKVMVDAMPTVDPEKHGYICVNAKAASDVR